MGGDSADDVAGGADNNIVSSEALFSVHLDSGAACIFRTHSLRPKQSATVKGITINANSRGRLLVVDRTGGGLILYMTALVVGGITLVTILLLALTANQLSRLQRSVQAFGVVSVYHLDNTPKEDLNKTILPKINLFEYESSTSMILLCSPQFIADNITFRNALIWARD